MKRWSKLQSRVEALFAPELGLRLHIGIYRMKSQRGSTDIPRYWLALGREILWDYPRDFQGEARLAWEYELGPDEPAGVLDEEDEEDRELLSYFQENPIPPGAYPYLNAIRWISSLLRSYSDAPLEGLLERNFPEDRWGLTDLLKVADRRLGRRRLQERYGDSDVPSVRALLAARLRQGAGGAERPRLRAAQG